MIDGIGKRLRKLREKKGLSQDYMANMLDFTQPAYAKYENEMTDISIKRLASIADILETDFSYFLGTSVKNINISDNKDSSINQYIENQNNEVKDLYSKIIENLEKEIEFLKEQIIYLRSK
jgi:transcriptional regulator with XRE-family HTH domain